MNKLTLATVLALIVTPGFATEVSVKKGKCERPGAPESTEPAPPLTLDMSKCDEVGFCAVVSPTTGAVLYMTRPDANQK
jgi:hypothetical protein